jgi:branched-chain amino acid transport system substrate-binding protein
MRNDILGYDSKAVISVPTMSGYWSAYMFVELLRKVGKNLTAEKFDQVANANWTWQVPNAICPIIFPLGHQEGLVGGSLVQIEGTQYKVPVPLGCKSITGNIHF